MSLKPLSGVLKNSIATLLAVLLAGVSSVSAQDKVSASSLLETKSNRNAVVTVLDHEPILQELRTARRSGDLDTVRRIEAIRGSKVQPNVGEAAAGTFQRPVTSRGGAGIPKAISDSAFDFSGDAYFGGDTHVRPFDLTSAEFSHTMASDSSGNIYVAWQDTSLTKDYIQVYYSSNDGASWAGFGYVEDALADLSYPSLAIAEGVTGDVLLLAYIVDDGVLPPVPEIAKAPLDTRLFSSYSVPVWAWESYDKPVICTDSVDFSGWYAYLTCEGIYSSTANNINTCTWRSTDGGLSWIDNTVLYGNTDTFAWIDPDVAYGTTLGRVCLVTYKENDLDIYTNSSDDYGITWNGSVIAASLGLIPNFPVDPEIAPAVNHDNVMVACTQFNVASGGNIGYTYSQDAGATWSSLFTLPGFGAHDDFAVALTANEGGASWHLAYTSGQDLSVHYNYRPQDLSTLWDSESPIVDDLGYAGTGGAYSRKGIASNWTTDVAHLAWADARDVVAFDYDTYADFIGNEGIMLTDQRMVGSDEEAWIDFSLNAGADNAGRKYFLLGSASGTSPGMPLPGGVATLPLNWDILTLYTLQFGAPLFVNFNGTLDVSGSAEATLYLPPNLHLPGGLRMYFAYAVSSPWDYASNPVAVLVSIT